MAEAGTEPRGLRALSPVLIAALAVALAWTVVVFVWLRRGDELSVYTPRLMFAETGMSFVMPFLFAWGANDLARRMAGRAATGMFVVAGAFAFRLALELVDLGLDLGNLWHHEWLYKTHGHAVFGSWAVAVIGACVAIAEAQLPLAIVLGVVGLVCSRPPPLADKLYVWLELGSKGRLTLLELMNFGAMAVVGVAAWLSARGRPIQDARRAWSGLNVAAWGLWGGLIAVGVLTMFTVSSISGHGADSESHAKLFRFAVVAGYAVNAVMFGWFAFGVLRVARADLADLPRWLFVAAASIAMFCAGVKAGQTPHVYRLYYEVSYVGMFESKVMESYSVLVPVLELVALLLAGAAVWVFAVRRKDEALVTHANGKVVGFVALATCSVLVENWFLPKATSIGDATLMMFGSAGALIWGQALIAMLLGCAAETLDREDGVGTLPPAKIISSGS